MIISDILLVKKEKDVQSPGLLTTAICRAGCTGKRKAIFRFFFYAFSISVPDMFYIQYL